VLDEPRTGAAGTLLNNTIYIAGGQKKAKGSEVTDTFWKLGPVEKKNNDIKWKKLQWRKIVSWPGSARAGAMAASQNDRLYLFGGFTLEKDDFGTLKRKYLNDTYSYDTKNGWKRVADVACDGIASAPVIKYGDSHIFVFGGLRETNKISTTGQKDRTFDFSGDILAYHTITDTWIKTGTMPQVLAFSNAVQWQGQIVVVCGKIRPAIVSNRCYKIEIFPKKASFGIFNTIVLVIYLLSLVAMGFYFFRREKTTADFFVGGRRVPWWAAGVSIMGTQISSLSFMAVPAKVYATDWLYYTTVICIVAVQPLIVYFYLPFYRRLNITSVYEYLEKRFNTVVRLFGSISFILFQCGRMTIVLFLPALALSAVTGLNIYLCILVMGVLATSYTALGGIEAVVWSDVLQVIVLVGGALTALVIIITNIDGGFAEVIEIAKDGGKFNFVDLGWDYTLPVLWVIVVGNLFLNIISYSADQAVVQRYLITKDEKAAAGAIWTNAAIICPITLVWFFLGTALYAFYKTQPQLLDATLKTDQIFPLFIAQQLPDGVIGLVIAGLFAASMSTVDSSLNSISTVFVTDFYRRFNPKSNDRSSLNLARSITVIFGIMATAIAMWMALNPDIIKSLWDIYMTVLSLLMGSLAGLFALGIFTRGANGRGAIVGAVAGAVMLYLAKQYTPMHFFLYSAVGITGCFTVGWLVSIFIGGQRKPLDKLTVYTT